jgi:cytochrome c553
LELTRQTRLSSSLRHLAPGGQLRHLSLKLHLRCVASVAYQQSNNGSTNMTHHRFPEIFGVLYVLTALAAPAKAAEAGPDPAMQREFSAKMQVCNQCHGTNGVPKGATIPIIWGQQETYLIKQLKDFHGKQRNIEVMTWMSESLTPEELEPAAAYFAKQKWPAKSASAASMPAPKGVAVCEACHQRNFVGTVSVNSLPAPRLAGQSYDYLVQEMRRFAAGERTNNADMMKIMEGMSPADREAMARYIAGL